MIIIYFLSFFVKRVQTKIVLHKTVNNGNYMGRWVKTERCVYMQYYIGLDVANFLQFHKQLN